MREAKRVLVTGLMCIFCVLVFLVFSMTVLAAEYSGTVVGVSDGDTLTLLTAEKQQIKVRLAEIDTPESRQPYGTRARQALSDLVFSKMVRIVVQDTDRYGRTVGRVYSGDTDVNAEMVKQGAAWVYRQYAKDQALFRFEDEAKAQKCGLWALPEAERCPPWDWRKKLCVAAPADAQLRPVDMRAQPVGGAFTCSGKRFCREMVSCEEAKFYLAQCGLTSIDGNRDGVPCETLCH